MRGECEQQHRHQSRNALCENADRYQPLPYVRLSAVRSYIHMYIYNIYRYTDIIYVSIYILYVYIHNINTYILMYVYITHTVTYYACLGTFIEECATLRYS
jgi:hypothetical protein